MSRYNVNDYMDQLVSFSGEKMSVNKVICLLLDVGFNQKYIDSYIQGLIYNAECNKGNIGPDITTRLSRQNLKNMKFCLN